jgi:cyclase
VKLVASVTLQRLAAAAAAVAALCPPASAQPDLSQVEIETVNVAPGLYMLRGAGGNIGLSVGEDGAFLIDDQYAPLTPKIKAAIAKLTPKAVRFVVNTHWHDDHTGGNENLGEAGAIIVAHDNVRTRMTADQFVEALDRHVPAFPKAALPVITFPDSVTFHWNGEEMHVFHVAPAHTDGDSIIHFRKADAVHMGDVYFAGIYPFIDASSGGRIDGVIAAADRVLAMVGDDTKIIPGHGPLSNKAGLREYRDMLSTVRDRVKAMVDAGESRDAVVAAKPTAEFDAKWGGGFLKPDPWVAIVYSTLAPK